MSKELEALEMMNMTVDIMCSTEYNEAKKIVEQALKEYEQHKAIEECTNIPFAKISSLKVGDVVYFKIGRISEGEVSNINYEDLIITILNKEGTFIDFALFHQYGKDRPPVHCWFGAWALTREELEK